MNPTGASAVEREVRIRARPETVFSFFTDPELMVRWMGAAAEIDPRPGGIYRVDIDGSHVALGEYVEVSPPDRGNPVGPSKLVSDGGSVSDGAPSGLTGYSVIAAGSLDGATELAKGCPVFSVGGSVEVYETFEVM